MHRLELHELYSATNNILVIQSGGGGQFGAECDTCEEKVLVGKVEGGCPLGITGRRLTLVILCAKITRYNVTNELCYVTFIICV